MFGWNVHESGAPNEIISFFGKKSNYIRLEEKKLLQSSRHCVTMPEESHVNMHLKVVDEPLSKRWLTGSNSGQFCFGWGLSIFEHGGMNK